MGEKRKSTDVLIAVEPETLKTNVCLFAQELQRTRTRTVENGEDLLRELQQGRWDCLITTEEFDGANYLGLTNLIRTGQISPPALPIIVVAKTANSGKEAVAKANHIRFVQPDTLVELPKLITASIKERLRPSILIIDDNQDYLDKLSVYFSDGFEVTTASNGKEGVAAYEAKRHDLVITDYMMPEFSGDDVAKSIRRISSHTPIVALTAHGTPENHALLTLSGISRLVEKSVRLSELERQCIELMLHADVTSAADAEAEQEAIREKLVAAIRTARREMETGQTNQAYARLRAAIVPLAGEAFEDD